MFNTKEKRKREVEAKRETRCEKSEQDLTHLAEQHQIFA
jgi:hypothetical protein